MMNELEMIETGASLFVRGAALLLGCWIASLAIRRSSGRVCSRL